MDPHLARSVRAPEIDSVLEILQKAFPDNEEIKTGILPLLSHKKAYVKTLLGLWDLRVIPPLSAMEVEETCHQFYRDHANEEALFQMSFGEISINTNKKFIHTYKVTSSGVPGSFGLDPYSGSYIHIQYEGELSFEKLFSHVIDFDSESKSLNLFESLKKILQRGNLIGFSESQWVSLLLQFSQKYLPGEYSALCRYESAEEATNLFQNIVRYLNTDSEVAKTRHQLSKITRALKEPIHLTVRNVQNHFNRLLALTFPTLDPEILRSRSEFMTTRCIPHLVSAKMAER